MAKSSSIPQQVSDIAEAHPDTQKGRPAASSRALKTAKGDAITRVNVNQQRNDARRAEAMNLRLAGFSYEVIAERLNVTESAVHALISRTLEKAVNHSVAELREVENARLDRAQAAIWPKIIAGDEKAIEAFLKISQRRAKLNGLDAPQQVNLSVSVKSEMETALGELRSVLLDNVIDAEVVEEDSDADPS